MTQDNVISEIKIGPSLLISGVSVAFGIFVNDYIKSDFGRVSFLSSLVAMLAVYSCRKSIRSPRVLSYIFVYTMLHICFSVAFGGSLEHVAGPIIILIAIVDYVIFYLGAQFFCEKF